MSSPSKWLVILLLAIPSFGQESLRFCTDPDNLPYSDAKLRGFENRLARLIAADLRMKPDFIFNRMRRGFVREQLNSGACDVLVGIPADYRFTLNTRPYYRSSFVFVSRKDGIDVSSFDDDRLNGKKIAIQALDENFAPPAQALMRRSVKAQIVPFEPFGANPAAMINAVLKRHVDLAIIWGPIAGYYAKSHSAELRLRPVSPAADGPISYTFAISMGVSKQRPELREKLDQAIAKHQAEIDSLLARYGVPRLALEQPAQEARR